MSYTYKGVNVTQVQQYVAQYGLHIEPKPYETRAVRIIAGETTMLSVALISVGLRIWSRRLNCTKLWIDDILIIIAMVTGIVDFGLHMKGVSNGLGSHYLPWLAPYYGSFEFFVKIFLRGTWINDFLYTNITLCVKCSMLALYWRMFGSTKKIRLPIMILLGLTIAWGVARYLTAFLVCRPVVGFWDLTQRESCSVHLKEFWIYGGLCHLLIEVGIVAIPLPLVWNMPGLSTTQKVQTTALFAASLSVFAMSANAFIALYHFDITDADYSWTLWKLALFTRLESSAAITCSCLATTRPILTSLIKRFRPRQAPKPRNGSAGSVTLYGTGNFSKSGSLDEGYPKKPIDVRLKTLENGYHAV